MRSDSLRALFSGIRATISEVAAFCKTVRGLYPRSCPLCGYRGRFRPFGVPLRIDALCPRCHSLERHRLFAVVDAHHHLVQGPRILHFAPEPLLAAYLKGKTKSYVSADLYDKRADCQENIEELSFANDSVDEIVCSHVLEHVDDAKALRELFRVLRPGGRLFLMVPTCDRESTYEDASIVDPFEREKHFGQGDHVRLYGRDFANRVRAAGFEVRTYEALPGEIIEYGLTWGEKIFVASKAV